jgi:hypothetical protein
VSAGLGFVLGEEGSKFRHPTLAKNFMTPDEEMNDLAIAFAKAMWKWNEVEAEWFLVYMAATDTFNANFGAILESYFSIVSPQTKLDMTNKAANSAWKGTPLLDTWRDLAERSREHLRKRGKLAHLVGYRNRATKPGQTDTYVVAQVVGHPAHLLVDHQPLNSIGYSVRQLDEIRKAWEQLERDLDAFTLPLWNAAAAKPGQTSTRA